MDHERECPPQRTFDSAFDFGRIQLTHFIPILALDLALRIALYPGHLRRLEGCLQDGLHQQQFLYDRLHGVPAPICRSSHARPQGAVTFDKRAVYTAFDECFPVVLVV